MSWLNANKNLIEEHVGVGIVQHDLAEDQARLNSCSGSLANRIELTTRPIANSARGFSGTLRWRKRCCFLLFNDCEAAPPLLLTDKLRLDHGALGTLIMPTPTRAIIKLLQTILDAHNALEESSEGVYAQCEKVAGVEIEDLLSRLQAVPSVSVAAYSDSPAVFATIRRVVMRAGYPT